mmetsp:Transcript_88336/g.247106  ORF Transcript_88336/g.247106 Transcript_88336/m.247106 type:complete len:570 (-) Transcript_88336:77-1786(-)
MAFRGHTLDRNYHFEYALGLWAFGTVQVLKDRRTDKLKTCKMVRKELVRNTADAMARLHRLRDLQHEHICAITDIDEDQWCMYIIYDKCQGGDVADWITRVQEEGNWLQEQTVAEYMRQTLIALAFAHGARASHRDLRPSNLALSSKLPDAKVMVADVGLADILDPQDEVVGSTMSPYAAPELRSMLGLQQPMDGASADMWSVGAIAHQLLVGTPPPKPERMSGPWAALTRGSVALCRETSDAWDSRSDLSRDFVRRLLKPRASERPSAAAMLQHPWIRSCYSLDFDLWSPEAEAVADIRSRLLCYLLAVLMLPARAQYRDVFQLRCAFASSDIDRDGYVPLAVARRLLRDRSALPSDADAALDATDVSRTGVVDLCALLAAWLITHSFCGPEEGEARRRQPRDLAQRLLRGFARTFGDAQRGVAASAESVAKRQDAVVVRELEMHAGVRYDDLIACLPEEDPFSFEALEAALCESQGRGTPLAVGEGGDSGEDSEHSWGDVLGLERVQDLVKNVFQTCGFAGAARSRWESQCEVVSLHNALSIPCSRSSKDSMVQQHVYRRSSGLGGA